jgi:hypothetical protein
VNLIGLSDFHALVAVLPIVRLGEHFFLRVVVVALVSKAFLSGELAAFVDGGRTAHGHVFGQVTVIVFMGFTIVLSCTVVLGTQVPVHIDRAESCLVVGSSDGNDVDFEISVVSLGYISSGLRAGLDDGFSDVRSII